MPIYTLTCGHEFRLILAVYHYTIGFNKLKDDMNGKRLEQITKIRYDHSNKTIVGLARKNIIVTNKGRYGKWMSINVEFDHWHEECQGLNNIDPTHLLPDECQNKPIDGGDTGLISDHLKPLDNPVLNSPSKPTIETKPTPKRAETSESLNTLEYLEQRGKKLTESITKSVLDVVAKQYPKATHPAKATATTVREATEERVTGGSLTLSEGDTHSPKDKQAEEERREKKYERQLAITDYQVMEKRIKGYAKKEQCSFSECLEKRELEGLWQGILNKLDALGEMPKDQRVPID